MITLTPLWVTLIAITLAIVEENNTRNPGVERDGG